MDSDNAIEDKKEKSTNPLNSKDVIKFLKNTLYTIFFGIVLTIFVGGGIGLFMTKVGYADFLPDDITKYPYTSSTYVPPNKEIDINIIYEKFLDSSTGLSQKIKFNSIDFLSSFKNHSLLGWFKKYATPDNPLGSVLLYLSEVLNHIMCNNYAILNTIGEYMYPFTEEFNMIIFGLFGWIFIISLFFFNLGSSIIFHIVKIKNILRIAKDNSNKSWTEYDNTGLFSSPLKLILLFFFWWLILIPIFAAPILTTLNALLSPLWAKYHFVGMTKTFSIMNFLINTFYYKKAFFMILTTLAIVSNAIRTFGYSSVPGLAITIIVAYMLGLY